MREMKDSGIEWIGAIPATWQMHPLYYYFCERKCRNTLGKENNLLSLSYGRVIRKDINTVDGLLPENYNGYNIIEKDDIVLRLTDLQNDKRSLRTGLVKEHGIITSAYTTIKANRELVPEFFQYLLHSYDAMKVLYNMGSGVRQGLNFSELSKMPLISPDMLEQKKIADFLDTKCSEIDAISADIQKEIEILEQYKRSVVTEAVTKGLNPDAEMKDSGNLRIGVTPAHWNVHKIKPYIASFSSGLSAVTSDNSGIESGKFVLRTSAVSTGVFKSEEVKSVLESAVDRLVCPVEPDTLVMSRMNTAEMVGYCAYINKPYPDYYLPDKLWKIRMQPSLNTKYAWFVINSSVSHAWFASVATGASLSMLNISRTDFENLVIPVPPREEQDFIADFLDRKCSMTNDIILDKKHQLEVLDLYKKSLIYEYITGKKEVPAQN